MSAVSELMVAGVHQLSDDDSGSQDRTELDGIFRGSCERSSQRGSELQVRFLQRHHGNTRGMSASPASIICAVEYSEQSTIIILNNDIT